MNYNNSISNSIKQSQNLSILNARVTNIENKLNQTTQSSSADVPAEITTSLDNIIELIGTPTGTSSTIFKEIEKISTTTPATKKATLAEVFNAAEGSYDTTFIPEPDTELSETEPSYTVENGKCTFKNINISLENSNYKQRLSAIRNLCKLYSSYEFRSSTFTNADLSYLFANNSRITSLPTFAESSISGNAYINGMFSNCVNIVFNTSTSLKTFLSVIDGDVETINMDNMFEGCSRLSHIDTGLDLSRVFENFDNLVTISMENMFSSVIVIDMKNRGIGLNMLSMFNTCDLLRSVNVCNMFKNLKYIKSFNTNIDMREMFANTDSIESIDLTNMFPSLTSLIITDASVSETKFNINMNNMFDMSYNLISVNMFSMMKELIKANKDETTRITYNNMFANIFNLEDTDKRTLTISYSGYTFSNAFGYHENNSPFEGDVTITPDGDLPAGFPINHPTWRNHYSMYDGAAQKIITWTFKSSTTSPPNITIKQETEILA